MAKGTLCCSNRSLLLGLCQIVTYGQKTQFNKVIVAGSAILKYGGEVEIIYRLNLKIDSNNL